MRIRSVELRRIAMPLVTPFRTSFGTETERDVLLVHVIAEHSDGWGECVAMRDPLYSSEYTAGAADVIARYLIPALKDEVEVGRLGERFASLKGHRMAKAAVEMALLDAELKQQDRSLATYLGGQRSEVECGVSVGIHEDIPSLLRSVEGYVEDGYRRIKLKIEPGWDLEPVAAVRRSLGDGFPLQVDANSAYTIEHAPLLARLDDFDLLLIEQPFIEEALRDHAALAGSVSTPICLDESITSAAVARDAIEMGACSIINIKSGRLGGLSESVAVHDLCLEAGVPVWCGGMLETGIGRAANVALASLPGFTLPGDTSASDRYFKEDLTAPFELQDGRLAVPMGAGLGVAPRAEPLQRLTVSSETFAV